MDKREKAFAEKKKLKAIKWIKNNRKYFKGAIGNKTFQELKAMMGNEKFMKRN